MIISTVKFAKRLFSLLSCSQAPSTNTKVFSSILLPGLCSNPDAFLTLYRSGVFQTSSPLAAMSRFAVKSIMHHKITNVESEHKYLEYLSVRVEDLEERELYNFFIKRTGSPDNPVLSSESLIPLMPMNELPSPSESSSHLSLAPVLSPSSTKSQDTWLERASPTSIQGAHAPARPRGYLAKADMILGAGYMRKVGYRSAQVVRKVTPSKLTFFELALLVDVVHDAPIYSLFEDHYYWFVKIICDAVVALSDDNCTDNDQESDINNQPYLPPPNRPFPPSTYLPSLSGTRNGVLVGDVRDRVLVSVLSNFSKRRDEEMAEVQRREQANFEALHGDEEMQRTAFGREEEIQALESDMVNLQAEMVDLLNKLHKFEGGNTNSSSTSNSAGHARPSSASI